MVRKLVFVRTMLLTGAKLHFKTRLKQSDVPSENKLFADAGKSTTRPTMPVNELARKRNEHRCNRREDRGIPTLEACGTRTMIPGGPSSRAENRYLQVRRQTSLRKEVRG